MLKELVDNALDSCEEADTPPEIAVVLNADGITVTDNGPGLPLEAIDGVLDFSVRTSSREAYIAPDRGAQGNALKTIVAMPYVLDGTLGTVQIETLGTKHVISFSADPIRQVPVIRLDRGSGSVHSGTSVTAHWPDSSCSLLYEARDLFVQVAIFYTFLNPHLSLTLEAFDDEPIEIEATNPSWVKWRPSDPTSAHWYKPEHLSRLVAGYLADDEDHGRDRTVREFVSEFRGLARTAKQKAVLDATGLSRSPLSSLRNDNGIDAAAVAALLDAMQSNSGAVKPEALGIIGEAHFREKFDMAGCEMQSFRYKRASGTTDGLPWVIETAFACRKDDEADRALITGINWSPGIVNPFRQLGAYGQSLDTILAQQRASRDEPVILALHMACPRVEYTDRGKSAVVIR